MTASDRIATCAQCPTMVRRLGVMFCGEPLTGKAVSDAPRGCGCCVTLKAVAATAKLTDCPQGKWNKVVSHGY